MAIEPEEEIVLLSPFYTRDTLREVAPRWVWDSCISRWKRLCCAKIGFIEERYAIILKNGLVDNCLIISILLIILGAFGAEDFLQTTVYQRVSDQ